MRRTGMLGLVCALVLAGLTGCVAATEGAVGVRLDADGRLVGVFDWCRGKAGTDRITLYLSKDDGTLTDKVIRLERDPGRSARTAEEVVLLDPGAGWQTTLAPPTLDDDQIYDLTAGNKDYGAVKDFPFRISELRGRTGSDVILTKQWDGGEHGAYVAKFHTPEDFARYANTVCDG
ncbi:hypothetical protein GCE86_24640 [Micromonospora terminaliae]|uniref:Lipoprotein n=1 Tax=Micromonospora terminaliae TaxID=1914461 RepID=A0AAJ3DKG0_9ACTN|nr:hypothetical protein [Micromonospora terminaliae]NES29899.1 hypothetical protein [Micromonospora terminaliae]QGL49926.1 hypothetical protein GCE86_24640 [Micromonospora terminaliae]